MKSILKMNVKTVKQMNSVQREVRLMRLLKHPHIVEVLDTLETPDSIYIVMEYASGGELFDYIVSNVRTPEQTARHFFRQIISAIDYCHKNLLLDAQGNIKIIDFGFGNTYHREKTLDTYCGSPFYAAPEMVNGTPYTGPEVDIWSIGVILYALLNGRLPFDSKDMPTLYTLISRGEYSPMEVSPAAENIIRIMLTVNPAQRAKMPDIIDHLWTNLGYSHKIESYVPERLAVVTAPDQAAVAELVTYGISEREVRRLLALECGQHPIKSLYSLVAEHLERRRREAAEAAASPQPTWCGPAASARRPMPDLDGADDHDDGWGDGISRGGRRAGVVGRPASLGPAAVASPRSAGSGGHIPAPSAPSPPSSLTGPARVGYGAPARGWATSAAGVGGERRGAPASEADMLAAGGASASVMVDANGRARVVLVARERGESGGGVASAASNGVANAVQQQQQQQHHHQHAASETDARSRASSWFRRRLSGMHHGATPGGSASGPITTAKMSSSSSASTAATSGFRLRDIGAQGWSTPVDWRAQQGSGDAASAAAGVEGAYATYGNGGDPAILPRNGAQPPTSDTDTRSASEFAPEWLGQTTCAVGQNAGGSMAEAFPDGRETAAGGRIRASRDNRLLGLFLRRPVG
ncbi:NUAK SNF1-like kinase 1 [Cladochytrium tenue]|nr:NUAK SNF1-like kinase 1 [Cladochytrium tenue]